MLVNSEVFLAYRGVTDSDVGEWLLWVVEVLVIVM